MATAKRTKNDYIFEHPELKNLFIRLRNSAGRRYVKSLGTTDRREAEIIALPMIAEHKARLLAARPSLETNWDRVLAPGLYSSVDMLADDEDPDHFATLNAVEQWLSDGGRVFASERELHYLDSNGKSVRTTANGGLALFATGAMQEALDNERPTAPTKNGDDAILEAYLKHANITGQYEREARATWALFKSLCDKPLKDADYADGRKLVEHFEAEGLKRATIEKKIGWLRAAVRQNMKTKNGLKFNPFSNVISEPKPGDSTRRLPLDDADMKVVKRNLAKLSEFDQLLFRLLASTGMRLSEAFEIDGEMKERGVRYVMVGKKTEQSLRRVPLPAAVLPYLRKAIKSRLFVSKHADPPDMASKRLGKFLDDIGITDPRKVVHSLRHRAQDRLRAAGCPEDVRWAILGHEEKTVAAGYGEGFPVPTLREWIDKIGC